MDREFAHPEVLEYLGFWRRRRQPNPSEEGGGEGNSNRNNSNPTTIFKVPGNIRQDEPKAYDPTVVSIGPLHGSNGGSSSSSNSQLVATEEIKQQCFRLLLGRRDPSPESTCMDKMKALEAGARECYQAHSFDLMSRARFAEILLLDGCFILYHLLKEYEDKRSSSSSSENEDGICCCEWMLKVGASCNELIRKVCNREMPRDDVDVELEEIIAGDNGGNSPVIYHLPMLNWRKNSSVKYDLLKIENQIPFYVIEVLFDLLRTPQDEDLVEIALNFFEVLHPKRAKPLFHIRANQVDHLLQLFHMSIIPEFLPCIISKLKDPTPTAMLLDWIPSATELQKSGVKFRKGENNEASNFLNIDFSKGVMEMGPVHIFDHSSFVFRNLIVFEKCSAVPPYVTIYAFFMRKIMRKEEDVRLLRSKGIVLNEWGSDEETALFFEQLCNQIQYPDRSEYLRDVIIEVKNYYCSRSHGWKATWHGWKANLVQIWAILVRIGTVLSKVGGVIIFFVTVEKALLAAHNFFRPPGSPPSLSPPSS